MMQVTLLMLNNQTLLHTDSWGAKTGSHSHAQQCLLWIWFYYRMDILWSQLITWWIQRWARHSCWSWLCKTQLSRAEIHCRFQHQYAWCWAQISSHDCQAFSPMMGYVLTYGISRFKSLLQLVFSLNIAVFVMKSQRCGICLSKRGGSCYEYLLLCGWLMIGWFGFEAVSCKPISTIKWWPDCEKGEGVSGHLH